MQTRADRPTADELRDAYLFIGLLVAFVASFMLLPVLGTLLTSLYRDVTYLPKRFIGLGNYASMLADPQFWQALKFTVSFAVVSVAIELVLGMALALVLNERLRFRGLLRVAVLIPWAIPVAVSARAWELIYNYDYGLFNYVVLKLGIASAPINWLGSPEGAFSALVLSDVWKSAPFVSMILLAGLSTIPKNLYKQAAIDGATPAQRFFRITLPLLKPVLIVALIFRTIDAVRVFDVVYVLTGGGPGGATTPLSLCAFNYFLSGDFGYGSAVSIVVFLIASSFALLYMRFGRFTKVLP
jgi:multiple sugar transport system permease protein